MVDSSPERSAFQVVLPRAVLTGAALGVLSVAATGLVLYDAQGLLAGATGLTATFAVALLMGMWAGAPDHDAPDLSINERWVSAGIAAAIAGAYASFLAVMGANAGGSLGPIVSLLTLVAVPAYVIGRLLPVILMWGERYEAASEEEPVGWGPLGALVVGVIGGFSGGVMVSGLLLVVWLGPGPLLLIVAVMLLGPVVVPPPEPRASNEHLLADIHSAFGHIRVTEMVFPGERQPERRMYLGEEQESGELVRSGAPTLPYIAAAEHWLTAHSGAGSSYLFLGGGAFTLPRRIAERDPSSRITVVELDPEVTRAAHRYFGLQDDHEIHTVHGDARSFVERETAERWDRIYLDVYVGTESLPYPLVTHEAFSAIRRCLSPGGVLGVNLIGVVSDAERIRPWSVLRTIGEVFPHLALYSHFGPDYPDRQNLLVLAGADLLGTLPPTMGLFDAWPDDAWRMDEGIVYHDLFTETVTVEKS